MIQMGAKITTGGKLMLLKPQAAVLWSSPRHKDQEIMGSNARKDMRH
jgi:hypothetical protein